MLMRNNALFASLAFRYSEGGGRHFSALRRLALKYVMIINDELPFGLMANPVAPLGQVLSTVPAEGQPYGVPVNYSYPPEGLYFHCVVEGHTLENLSGNSPVSFCVVGRTEAWPDKFETKYESVIVFGRAVEVLEAEKHPGLVELAKRYSR